MKCPICDGEGGWREEIGEGTVIYESCPACNETGKVNLWWIIKYWFMNTRLTDILYDL